MSTFTTIPRSVARTSGISGPGVDPAFEAQLAGVFAAISSNIGEDFGDPNVRRAVAAAISKVVLQGFEFLNVLEQFADVQYVGENEEIEIRLKRGPRAYWTAEGAQVDSTDAEEYVWRLERDFIGYALDELAKKLLNNFTGNIAGLMQDCAKQLLGEINRRFFELIMTLTDDSTDYYEEGAGLSLSWVRHSLTRVKDASRSRKLIIAGRATMTDQLMDLLEDAGEGQGINSDGITSQMVDQGVLARYRGALIVEWTNYDDQRGGPRLPANELIIIGPDSATVGFWGGMESWEQMNGEYWEHWTKQAVGMAVHRADRLRRFHDTRIDARDGELVSA